ncbi:hypothetical protein VNO78_25887 [Psophocarpus tetragonolobus]|uniref:Uncharacterized protein n=1 Tax=Psophocarpus tetragonolobus TaxID=3891 RepID=A0AAN9S787_PSOTE
MARLSPTGSRGHATRNRICFLTGLVQSETISSSFQSFDSCKILGTVFLIANQEKPRVVIRRLKKLFTIGTERRIVKVFDISAPDSAQGAIQAK